MNWETTMVVKIWMIFQCDHGVSLKTTMLKIAKIATTNIRYQIPRIDRNNFFVNLNHRWRIHSSYKNLKFSLQIDCHFKDGAKSVIDILTDKLSRDNIEIRVSTPLLKISDWSGQNKIKLSCGKLFSWIFWHDLLLA